MNQQQIAVVKMLASVEPTSKPSILDAIQALGHGIAVLSTSSGNRAAQHAFLETTFAAIRQDAEETMCAFEHNKGLTDPPISASVEAQAAELLQAYMRAPGAKSNG
jgi:hypothetical protein